ncbi:MAG: GNAT family N-acetyltransferase [Eubacteriales bacterium]|nr:GNAT family N-acetyltransferase [Eubacteriales bacterium]
MKNINCGHEIRQLDVETCRKYQETLWKFYYENLKDCAFTISYTIEEAKKKIAILIGYLEVDQAIVLGCFKEENLVAYLWSYVHFFREEKRIYISEIYVDSNWRNMGIARELLNKIERIAIESHINALYLHVEAQNIGALQLYQSEGYLTERIQLRKGL